MQITSFSPNFKQSRRGRDLLRDIESQKQSWTGIQAFFLFLLASWLHFRTLSYQHLITSVLDVHTGFGMNTSTSGRILTQYVLVSVEFCVYNIWPPLIDCCCGSYLGQVLRNPRCLWLPTQSIREADLFIYAVSIYFYWDILHRKLILKCTSVFMYANITTIEFQNILPIPKGNYPLAAPLYSLPPRQFLCTFCSYWFCK